MTHVIGCQQSPRRGTEVIESYTADGATFRLRVREFNEEHPVLLSKCYFVVEYAPAGTESWRELATDITDDDIPIPSDHIRFIDDMTAYVFLWRLFASTTDGGRTWSVWDAREEVLDWECCNQAYIKALEVGGNGKGSMTLAPKFRDIEVRELHTSDFGKHWYPRR